MSTSIGPVMDKETRNNYRLMVEDQQYCNKLYERLRPHIPEQHEWDGVWNSVNLNERFRFYKYSPGQYFNKRTCVLWFAL